jgi:hypothetical protein
MNLNQHKKLDLRNLVSTALLLCCATLSYAQIETPKIDVSSTDSIQEEFKNRLANQKDAKDSLISQQREKLNNAKDNARSAAGQKITDVKTKSNETVGTYKDSLKTLRDSLWTRTRRSVLGEVPSKDSLKNQLGTTIKEAPKKVVKSTRLSGEIVSESFITNYQDPFTVSEKAYSRLYGNPTIEVAKLPFTVDFFVTTEPNTVYNSNTINLRFNTEQFKQNIRQTASNKLRDVQNKKNELGEFSFDLQNQKKRLGAELDKQKSQLGSTEARLKGLEDQAKGKIPSTPELPDTDGLSEAARRKTENEWKKKQTDIEQKGDSLITNTKRSYMSEEALEKLDSNQQAEYLRKKEQYEQMQSRYNEAMKTYQFIDSIYQMVQKADSIASGKLDEVKNQYTQPDLLKSKATEKLKSKKLASLVSSVDYFEVGINYPYFSKLSLNGSPSKGLNSSFTFGNNQLKVVAGKTINNRINTFGLGQPNPVFDRYVQGVSYRKDNQRGFWEISNAVLWDPSDFDEPKRNIIQTLTWQRRLGKKLDLEVNSAHAMYSDNIHMEEISPSDVTFLEQRMNGSALGLKANYRLDGQSKLKVEGQRIYPGFVNLSNPFMRNGYDEYKGQLDRKFFKRRLHTSVFYKHFSDNITGIQESTNTMDGYGITVRTNFREAWNFFAQHAPYEQGNNHPDSIFRTNNQLSVTTAGAIYMKKIKESNIMFMANYTRSHIDFNKGDAPVENQFYNAMLTITRPKILASLNGYRNESKPRIDTLNYSGLRLEIAQQGKSTVQFSTNLFFDYYDSQDYRYNWTASAQYNGLKRFQFVTSFGLGRIEGLFGLENKDIYSGQLLIKYTL